MPTPPLSYATLVEAVKAVQEHGSISAAAYAMGLPRNTLQSRIRVAREKGLTVEKPPTSALAPGVSEEDAEPPKPVDIHDAAFWRKEAKRLEKEQGRLHRIMEELGGIRGVPLQIPEWLPPERKGGKGRAVIGMLLSDIHDGEVISAEEISGINAYDPDVCSKRLMRYFEASCVIGERWAQDCNVEGAFIALAGDLIAGEIHEELARTNALTSTEAVQHVTGLLYAGIERVLEAFGRAHIVGVPGNHGRTTRKPTAKMYARLNYDTMIVSLLAERFRGDERVTFQSTAAKDQVTPIFGRSVFTTHGDKIGTRGGQGFVGPNLPISRGALLLQRHQGAIERRPDLIQFGHYHTTGNPYIGVPVLANGSVCGYAEYGDDNRFVAEPPQQWTYLLHDRWWLRERQPIILTDLKPPEKPRVRVPVEMS